MKGFLIGATIAIATMFVACDNSPKFTIEGNITNADSMVLYLENITKSNPIIVDSAILNAKGAYKFRQAVPSQAQFYRLRLGKHSINLVADTVAHIVCNSDAAQFSTGYTIEGSDDCSIMREVDLAGSRLKGIVNQALKSDSEDVRQAASDSVKSYKKRMTDLILQAPASPVAYYILMQRVNGLPIFDTFDKADNRIIAAAATAHEVYATDAPRTEILRNIALQGMATNRPQREHTIEVDADKVDELNFIDIALYDLAGNQRKLSDVAAEKRVVLLDFTAYALDYSPAYNIQLNNIYETYRNKGLEIYQVSFDTELSRWQTVADNLPWVCVHDADNIYSTLIPLYDVQSLPTCYIIVDNGERFMRPTDVDDLKQKLAQILG
ncbi:MAG: DUF4369 domain-containing protein [Bacteroidaceae bacterium]|nr:DUF4369 domain-containing protein [Bacteroidaceae bacterium]